MSHFQEKMQDVKRPGLTHNLREKFVVRERAVGSISGRERWARSRNEMVSMMNQAHISKSFGPLPVYTEWRRGGGGIVIGLMSSCT